MSAATSTAPVATAAMATCRHSRRRMWESRATPGVTFVRSTTAQAAGQRRLSTSASARTSWMLPAATSEATGKASSTGRGQGPGEPEQDPEQDGPVDCHESEERQHSPGRGQEFEGRRVDVAVGESPGGVGIQVGRVGPPVEDGVDRLRAILLNGQEVPVVDDSHDPEHGEDELQQAVLAQAQDAVTALSLVRGPSHAMAPPQGGCPLHHELSLSSRYDASGWDDTTHASGCSASAFGSVAFGTVVFGSVAFGTRADASGTILGRRTTSPSQRLQRHLGSAGPSPTRP